jgi:octopine/nopaline transport system substrate-binding protein
VLLDMFNEAIGAAIADGTIKQLSEKWLKADVTPAQ